MLSATDALLGWLLALPREAAIVVLALLTSGGMTLARKLVTDQDLRGILHAHTDLSDGVEVLQPLTDEQRGQLLASSRTLLYGAGQVIGITSAIASLAFDLHGLILEEHLNHYRDQTPPEQWPRFVVMPPFGSHQRKRRSPRLR